MKLLEIFSEQGHLSMMRVMSFIVCLTGCFVAISNQDPILTGVLLTAAFTGKVVQRHIEK